MAVVLEYNITPGDDDGCPCVRIADAPKGPATQRCRAGPSWPARRAAPHEYARVLTRSNIAKLENSSQGKISFLMVSMRDAPGRDLAGLEEAGRSERPERSNKGSADHE